MTPSEPPSEPPSEQSPPPRPGPSGPRRFDSSSVTLGAVVGFFGTPLLLVVAVIVVNGVARALDGVSAAPLVVLVVALVVFLGPLIAAIVRASRHGSPQQRGFALGVAIGWAVFLVVGAGACVALLRQLG